MDPFTAGDHYGPVLDPFLIHVVEARIMINPLIQPPPEEGPDRPFLKWDMIHAANACQRTTDPANMSWSTGRDEPATAPRVSSLRLVSRAFPWMIEVHARSLDTGVTCGDVIDTLDDSMHKLSTEKDWTPLTPVKQRAVRQAYNHNRSTASGVPGGRLGRGLRRLDFLGHESMFGGIVKDDALVTAVCGAALPCTFVVKCIRRYPPTPQEVREQQARQRSAATSRAPTVTEETDEDDDDSEH
ncbi:hypothetical protein BD779DRAFT_1609427 [Infundibulicybe gibba]|nr:hypothetical protein BD779DRAFT_1609427 [Infundibulicybe gibba]